MNCLFFTLLIWLRRGIILVIAMLVISGSALGQEFSAFSLFNSDSIVDVRLTTDMKLLVRNKYKETYQPATLQIINAGEDTSTFEVKIRSRGNTRKKACSLPPIKVKFSKKEFNYNDLKWVMTCNNSDAVEQVLLKEYMVYQIFQKYSDIGFKTELLRVEYIDTGRGNKSHTRYAFVIEDADQVAERLGGRVYDPKVLKNTVLNKDQLALFTMFQYMIANTDWAVSNLHNLEAVTDPGTNSVLVLPYDFDYAGFVDAHYAVVHESLPFKEVTERYNKGFCISEESCEQLRMQFLSKRNEVLQACREFKYFDKKTRKSTESYMKAFFDIMESQKATQRIFCKDCKNGG